MGRRASKDIVSRILDSVIACKISTGGEVTAARIAELAGISTRTLNRYFPDKGVLMFEAAAWYLNGVYAEITERYAALALEGYTGLERLMAFLQTQTGEFRRDPSAAVIFVEANICCISTSALKGCRKPGFAAAVTEILLSNLQRGIEDGSIRAELSPQKTALLIVANLNGLMQRLAFLGAVEAEQVELNDFFSLFDEYISMLRLYLRPASPAARNGD